MRLSRWLSRSASTAAISGHFSSGFSSTVILTIICYITINNMDLILTMAELKTLGVAFVVPGHIDISTPMGRMMTRLLSVLLNESTKGYQVHTDSLQCLRLIASYRCTTEKTHIISATILATVSMRCILLCCCTIISN